VKSSFETPPAMVCLLSFLSWNNASTTMIVEAFTAPSTPATIPYHGLNTLVRRPSSISFVRNDVELQVYRNNIKVSTTLISTTTQLRSSNNNDNEDGDDENSPMFFDLRSIDLSKRIKNVDPLEIRRDAVLCAVYVFWRFLVYEEFHGYSQEFGLQDALYFTGTLSSAAVLATFWTVAGLLSRNSELRLFQEFRPIPVLVNVALCCPIWIATEHALKLGPPDIGGETLEASIFAGFTTLSLVMVIGKFAIFKTTANRE